MATTRTRQSPTETLSFGAYALVGAADRILQEARTLASRREQIPDDLARQLEESVDQLRDSVEQVLEHLNARARSTADQASTTVESLADRGQAIIGRLRADEEVDEALTDAEQAREGWLGAVTSLRRNADKVARRVKAAATMTGEAAGSAADAASSAGSKVAGARKEVDLREHTKAELYELATQRDIEGRSSMSKDQLVDALSS